MSTTDTSELSKEYITEALFLLMEKKPYESISITDITQKAGVGRATYYRHFKTKDDIIRWYFKQQAARFIKISPVKASSLDDYYEIIFNTFSQLKENKNVIQKLITARLEYLYLDYLNESMLENFQENHYIYSPYASYYTAGSLFNVSIEWVRNDCAESVKQLTDSYFGMMFHAADNINQIKRL